MLALNHTSWSKTLFLVISCLYIPGCTVTKTKVTNIPYHSNIKKITSTKEAEKLETKLKKDPNNLSIRSQLIIFYKSLSQRDHLEKRQYKHILWIIKNRPASKIAGSHKILLNPITDGQTYETGKQLWLGNIKKFNKNEIVINNAAEYLLSFDRDIAKELLQKGKRLYPTSPKWATKLAHLYFLDAIVGDSNSGKKALKELELAYSLTSNRLSKYYMLTDLTQYAYVAKEKKKAKQYAIQLLNISKQYSKDWNYGNSIHMGNQVLGKLALDNDNIADAKKYLIASAKIFWITSISIIWSIYDACKKTTSERRKRSCY